MEFVTIEKKSGVIICTRGWRKIFVNGRLYDLKPGMMQLNTPAFMVQIIDQSADFESLSLMGDKKVLFPVVRSILPIMINHGAIENPVLEADEKLIELAAAHVEEMEKLRNLQAQCVDPDERKIIEKIIETTTLHSVISAIHMVYKKLPRLQNSSHAFSETVAVKFLLSLQHNYMQHRKVSWYAAEANMSTGHFSKTIRDTLGKLPSQLIVLFTIQNAKLLLGNTAQNIKEISAQLGFPEQFTFRKYFKTYTGVSPSDYRRMQATAEQQGGG